MRANAWGESLPLGNGRIGGMIFGGIYADSVALNEVTCWSGENHPNKNLDNDSGPIILAKIQKELFKTNSDYDKLSQLYKEFGGKNNTGFGTNRPFGRLNINIDRDCAYVSYDLEGVSYEREAFISNPGQVLVMRYSSTEKGKISFIAKLETEIDTGGTGVMNIGGRSLVYDGVVYGGGVTIHARLKAITIGGKITYTKDGLRIEDADEVTLILALGTTFDYHLDMNVEMNQWFTGAANLSEGEMPVFKYLEEWLIPSGRNTAHLKYGKNGWLAHTTCNAWGYGGTDAVCASWTAFTTGGAWLCQEVMNYFDYTWDTEFLEYRGYAILKETAEFCFECDKFPCQRLKQLDMRYQTKYKMSTIENLEHIKQYGIDKFLQNEEIRWTCKECGNVVCVHKFICIVCKNPYMK